MDENLISIRSSVTEDKSVPAIISIETTELPANCDSEVIIPAKLAEKSEVLKVSAEEQQIPVSFSMNECVLIQGPKGETGDRGEPGEQGAKGDAGRDGGAAYTSLHYSRKDRGNSPIMRLVVKMQGIEYEDGLYIQCQQMNRRKRVKRWLDGCRGYKSIMKSGIGDGQHQYPDPPDWMPNGGEPVDQWPVISEMFGNEHEGAGHWNGVEIDLREWLLDFLKPTNETPAENIAEEYTDDMPSTLTGVSYSKKQWLRFRFLLKNADGTVAAQPIDSLVIGMRAVGGSVGSVQPYELADEARPDLFYIDIR